MALIKRVTLSGYKATLNVDNLCSRDCGHHIDDRIIEIRRNQAREAGSGDRNVLSLDNTRYSHFIHAIAPFWRFKWDSHSCLSIWTSAAGLWLAAVWGIIVLET